jgi:hypothetical protein
MPPLSCIANRRKQAVANFLALARLLKAKYFYHTSGSSGIPASIHQKQVLVVSGEILTGSPNNNDNNNDNKNNSSRKTEEGYGSEDDDWYSVEVNEYIKTEPRTRGISTERRRRKKNLKRIPKKEVNRKTFIGQANVSTWRMLRDGIPEETRKMVWRALIYARHPLVHSWGVYRHWFNWADTFQPQPPVLLSATSSSSSSAFSSSSTQNVYLRATDKTFGTIFPTSISTPLSADGLFGSWIRNSNVRRDLPLSCNHKLTPEGLDSVDRITYVFHLEHPG